MHTPTVHKMNDFTQGLMELSFKAIFNSKVLFCKIRSNDKEVFEHVWNTFSSQLNYPNKHPQSWD